MFLSLETLWMWPLTSHRAAVVIAATFGTIDLSLKLHIASLIFVRKDIKN